ncbi:MAG: indole-3-glycerol phosphate synthase TrpC [Chitinophagaceae bacterium]|nr:indole-3-glycerol phosphate synthase TrpC [Chitinophagaceae bacterium]
MNILEEIVERKKKEIELNKKEVPISTLVGMPYFGEECYPFVSFIKDPMRSGIIAEFKRKSPSKGWINEKANAERITRGYASFGASALSVLTDYHFFGGSLEDLKQARWNGIPILRKDFIIDEYQILETKAWGADVLLLIAACLTKREIKDFSHTAKNLGLSVFLELHSEEELENICDEVDAIGINNRNLKTFEVDLENSIRMAKQIPAKLKISESGIDSMDTIRMLRKEGFNGFLIGERFMKEKFPAISFKEFLRDKK